MAQHPRSRHHRRLRSPRRPLAPAAGLRIQFLPKEAYRRDDERHQPTLWDARTRKSFGDQIEHVRADIRRPPVWLSRRMVGALVRGSTGFRMSDRRIPTHGRPWIGSLAFGKAWSDVRSDRRWTSRYIHLNIAVLHASSLAVRLRRSCVMSDALGLLSARRFFR